MDKNFGLFTYLTELLERPENENAKREFLLEMKKRGVSLTLTPLHEETILNYYKEKGIEGEVFQFDYQESYESYEDGNEDGGFIFISSEGAVVLNERDILGDKQLELNLPYLGRLMTGDFPSVDLSKYKQADLTYMSVSSLGHLQNRGLNPQHIIWAGTDRESLKQFLKWDKVESLRIQDKNYYKQILKLYPHLEIFNL